MKKYDFFDHTADLGLRIYGASLGGLFENAGFALFDVLADLSRVEPRRCLRFSLQRGNAEELLAEWLGGLLYEFDAKGLLLSRFSIERIDGRSLEAAAGGEPFRPGRHELRTAVKAVTYHGLSVRRQGGLWLATVVLDV